MFKKEDNVIILASACEGIPPYNLSEIKKNNRGIIYRPNKTYSEVRTCSGIWSILNENLKKED